MFLAGTIICFLNHGRINMVENRYHDLMIFFLSAVLISLSLFCIIKRLRSDRYLRLFVYLGGGKNTIIILGFNYLLNTLFVNGYKWYLSEKSACFWMLNSLFVIALSIIIIYFYNGFRKWIILRE